MVAPLLAELAPEAPEGEPTTGAGVGGPDLREEVWIPYPATHELDNI